MLVKNDYRQCITSIGCSVQRYFGLQPAHESLSDLDSLLDREQPENVVVLLYDGMGSRILDRHLSPESFLQRNRFRELTTVFPATTTAATTSVICGLNPIEHGYLGWDCYVPPLDKVITLFRFREKGHQEICQPFIDLLDQFQPKRIIDQINEAGEYQAYGVSPFMEVTYETYDEMLDKIVELTRRPGRKYIYAYDTQPDSAMHHFGPDSPEVIALIEERNRKSEILASKLENTLLIITADHGHMAVENYILEDYPQLLSLLERPVSIEPRAASFKIIDGKKKEFERVFKEIFADDFSLYEAEEVIQSGLFGPGNEHPWFRQQLGDYLAVSYGNKAMVQTRNEAIASQHAGYSDDEIYIPLITVYMGNKPNQHKEEGI